ncbi:MAG: c-type cytochrome [Chloroflexi bacterium]|nr:c-type cytochrome [Chloroflexota bacterium]
MKNVRFPMIAILPLAAVIGALLVSFVPRAAIAQEEVPPPYAGMKNPFRWEDPAAQEAGKKTYLQSCVGCHGVKGDGVPTVHFGDNPELKKHLEDKPDHHFWVLSEGRLNKGMPPYKSSLSEEVRWQVLTYLWSLAAGPVAPVTPPPTTEGISLSLTIPREGSAGQPMAFSAELKGKDGKPIAGEAVKFLAKVAFLNGPGLMDIGEAKTDARGIARLDYTPRFDGEVQFVARFGGAESSAVITLAVADKVFYTPHIGIDLPAPGPEVVFGPKSAMQLDEDNNAPTAAFRLPGGIISWLLTVVGTVALIWFTYFRVMYQVFSIPSGGRLTQNNPRLAPTIGMVVILTLGITLLLMLLTGPISHWHVMGH